MTQTIQQERYLWIKPIIQKKLTYAEVLKTCPHSKRSLERWVAAYKRGGIEALEPQSTEPKTQQNETSIELKERVVALRKETGLCALKLHWRGYKNKESRYTRVPSARFSRKKVWYGSTAPRK